MTKTLIFNSFEEFKQREDNSINGVSPDFAEKYPEYEQDIEGTWCHNKG